MITYAFFAPCMRLFDREHIIQVAVYLVFQLSLSYDSSNPVIDIGDRTHMEPPIRMTLPTGKSRFQPTVRYE